MTLISYGRDLVSAAPQGRAGRRAAFHRLLPLPRERQLPTHCGQSSDRLFIATAVEGAVFIRSDESKIAFDLSELRAVLDRIEERVVLRSHDARISRGDGLLQAANGLISASPLRQKDLCCW